MCKLRRTFGEFFCCICVSLVLSRLYKQLSSWIGWWPMDYFFSRCRKSHKSLVYCDCRTNIFYKDLKPLRWHDARFRGEWHREGLRMETNLSIPLFLLICSFLSKPGTISLPVFCEKPSSLDILQLNGMRFPAKNRHTLRFSVAPALPQHAVTVIVPFSHAVSNHQPLSALHVTM